MSRYDLSRASDLALLAAVRAGLGSPYEPTARHPLDPTTRRCLEAFATLLVDEPAEGFLELEVLRTECRKRTRAEFDQEIGDRLREWMHPGSTGPVERTESWWNDLRALVNASRSAPDGEKAEP